MSVTLKPGTRLFSAVCATEMIAVRCPGGDVDVTIGGVEPVLDAAQRESSASPSEGHDGGTLMGKRYVDEAKQVYGGCGPRLNEEKDPSEWLGKPNGPAAKLENEKPKGETVNYDQLVKRWESK